MPYEHNQDIDPAQYMLPGHVTWATIFAYNTDSMDRYWSQGNTYLTTARPGDCSGASSIWRGEGTSRHQYLLLVLPKPVYGGERGRHSINTSCWCCQNLINRSATSRIRPWRNTLLVFVNVSHNLPYNFGDNSIWMNGPYGVLLI